ncbi:SPOR domain-containing protein [Salana multivorans]
MTDDVTQTPGESGRPAATGGGDLTEAGYYYNLTTGEVERGQQSTWTERIGPYPTREAAQRALDTARRRTEAWDEEDRRWRGDE